MTDLTPEQQAACDAYWAAETFDEQRVAYKRMMALGFPDSYGIEAWGMFVDGVDYTQGKIRALVAENKLLRANPWHRDEGGVVKSLVAIPGTELIAMSDTEIVGIVVWKDRLICATKKGVFERCLDGKFREIKFAPAENRYAWESTAKAFNIGVDVARGPDEIAAVVTQDGKITAINLPGTGGWRQPDGSLGYHPDNKITPAPPEPWAGNFAIPQERSENPPPPPLKPSERLYPGPIASAIYTDIVQWQTKNYGVAPPCWMISRADYDALWGEMNFTEPPKEVWIAGIRVAPDPAEVFSPKPSVARYSAEALARRGIKITESEDVTLKLLSEVTREHIKPCASILRAAYEGPDHVLTQGEEDDPPLRDRGFGTDKDG